MAGMESGLMRPGSLRRLTAGERALAGEVFGAALDAERVRVFAWPAPWPQRAFVPGQAFGRSVVVYPRAGAALDFSQAPARRQAVFVHELVHCWQAQQGVSLPWAKLRAGDGPRAYAYDLTAGRFEALNIEQQAQAVEDAFRLSRGLAAPHGRELYAAVLPFPLGVGEGGSTLV